MLLRSLIIDVQTRTGSSILSPIIGNLLSSLVSIFVRRNKPHNSVKEGSTLRKGLCNVMVDLVQTLRPASRYCTHVTLQKELNKDEQSIAPKCLVFKKQKKKLSPFSHFKW
jgi:hypothetical protein